MTLFELPAPVALPVTARRTRLARNAVTLRVVARHLSPLVVERARRRTTPPAEVGRRLRQAFEDLGPTYVKLGQMVGSSPGTLEPAVSDELRSCLDTGPPVRFTEVRAAVEEATGRKLERTFRRFDREAVADASIAVVHRATTRDGRRVAVKVLRPGIAERVAVDLDVMESMFRRLARRGVGTAAGLHHMLPRFRAHIADLTSERVHVATSDQELDLVVVERGENRLRKPPG
ncbi:MAG: ubiquinone biosynthesis protein [Actinomycetota bacterium]|nr:ubiquinone biosynthesis protein [Actinomycetota bacterium]